MKSFEALIKDAPVLLDGATGTCLMAEGMPIHGCRELWMLEHEEAVIRLQCAYAAAGSRIVYAPTFTAQPCRLETHGLEDQTEEINCRLAGLSKAAAPDCLIAGSMTTLAGMRLTREEMICQYRRQTGFGRGRAEIPRQYTRFYGYHAALHRCGRKADRRLLRHDAGNDCRAVSADSPCGIRMNHP